MRDPILQVAGHATVLARDDIDTDALFPAEFLKVTVKQGMAQYLFADWLAAGHPEAAFVRAPAATRVLVVPRNFGCGSSREHAVWALADYGIQAILALSFGDIFRNNCVKNGVVAAVVSAPDHHKAVAALQAAPAEAASITLDVAIGRATLPGGETIAFALAPGHAEQLLSGEDDINRTLRYGAELQAYEARVRAAQPWLERID